jgi:hypothetical protein
VRDGINTGGVDALVDLYEPDAMLLGEDGTPPADWPAAPHERTLDVVELDLPPTSTCSRRTRWPTRRCRDRRPWVALFPAELGDRGQRCDEPSTAGAVGRMPGARSPRLGAVRSR